MPSDKMRHKHLLTEWRPTTRVLGVLATPAILRLVTALLPPDTDAQVALSVAAGVGRKINLMPIYLGIPILGLTLLFDLFVRGFGLRSLTAAAASVRRFASSSGPGSGGPFGNVIALYDRLANFILYSRASEPVPIPPLKPFDGSHLDSEQNLSCEVLVVGSGPGGSVTAAILARAGYDVLLLEEGPDTRRTPTPSYSSQEMDAKYRNGGLTPCLGKARVTYAEARCLGGGSEINSGFFHRVPESVLEEWQQSHVLPDLTAASLAPYYDEIIRKLSIGPIDGDEGASSRKIKQGADQLGWISEEVPRWISSHKGTNRQWQSSRTGMSASFIPDAIAAGCRVITNIAVDSLTIDGGAARFATARLADSSVGGTRLTLSFKWVFICAGAIGTPALLRRSGLKRNIGDSLQIHPMVRTVARFGEAVNESEFGVPVRQVVEFKPDLTLGCSMSSLAHLALWMAGRRDRFDIEGDIAELSVFYALVRSRTFGRIRDLPLVAEPLVFWNLAPDDYARLGDGLEKLCTLLFTAGAQEIFLPIRGLAPVTSTAQLQNPLARLADVNPEVTAIHLFGSCPLGGDAERFPLEPYGKLRQASNLFVNDASMLPGAMGVNPQGTIMAVAMRNAQAFLTSARPGG
jgi:GMC oxidoreductase